MSGAEVSLIKAVKDLFPEYELQIRHSVSRGIFFEILDYHVTPEDAVRIERRMRELVEMNIPFIKVTVSIDEARKSSLREGVKTGTELLKIVKKIMLRFIYLII